MEIRVICCKCGEVISEGDAPEPVSHSYCDTCGADLIQEIDQMLLEEQEVIEDWSK